MEPGVQITVRNVSPELARRLKAVAAERNESVNTVVLEILEGAMGINERRARLDRYATWTPEDLHDFEGSLREQRVVDADLWR
jgi:plasmid stability protein